MEVQIYGPISDPAVKYSVLLDHIVQPPLKKYLAIVGIHFYVPSNSVLSWKFFLKVLLRCYIKLIIKLLIKFFCSNCFTSTAYTFLIDSGTTAEWGLHLRNVSPPIIMIAFCHVITSLYPFHLLVSSSINYVLSFVACFKLTSCNPNTANQNMHAFGVMVIVSFCSC